MFREYRNAVREFSANARVYLTATILLGVTSGIQYLFFNLYVLSLDYDQAFIGLLASLPALMTAIAAIPIGMVLPRLGYRRGLLLGCFLIAVALLGCAVLPSRGVLIAACVLSGFGSALTSVASSPLMVAISTEKTRTHLFGVQFAFSTFAGVLANLVGGYLPLAFRAIAPGFLAGLSAYRGVLLISMGLTLAALYPIARLRGLHGARGEALRARDVEVHRSLLAKILAVEITGSFGAGMLMPFLNVFYRLRFNLPDPALGAVFAASSLFTGIAAILAPLAAARMGKIRAIVLTQAMSIPFLLAMGFVPNAGVSATSYLVRTALMNMSSPLLPAYIMGIVPGELRPLTASLMMLAWNAGWALSSWISGHIQVAAGFSPLFLITAGFYVTSTVLTYVFFRRTAETANAPVLPEPLPSDESRHA
ncbi:MAG: MFS transporter [Thermotogota bacterium]